MTYEVSRKWVPFYTWRNRGVKRMLKCPTSNWPCLVLNLGCWLKEHTVNIILCGQPRWEPKSKSPKQNKEAVGRVNLVLRAVLGFSRVLV